MSNACVEFSLIVPTYNERENIEPLLRTLSEVLSHIRHELIVVDDDAPDCTWKIVERVALEIPEIRLVHRKAAYRDQAQSLMEGFRVSRGAILGSINADGSHPPQALPALLATIAQGEFRIGDWLALRRWRSDFAMAVAQEDLKQAGDRRHAIVAALANQGSVERLLHRAPRSL